MPINPYMPFLFFAVVLISFKLPSFLKPEEDCTQKARSPAKVSRCNKSFAKLPAKYEGLSLHDAIKNKDTQALQALIQSGANVNAKKGFFLMTPLHLAAQHYPQAIKPLIKAGADVNAQDRSGDTPLHLASEYQPEAVPILIEAGADVHTKNRAENTPLHNAAKYQLTIIQPLIEAGADIHARNIRGWTPLHSAAQHQLTTIQPLIKAGASVHAHNKLGQTPLYIASEYQPKAIPILIKAGANVNAKDEYGDTPLHIAAKYQPTAIPILAKAGANVNAKNNNGWTPFYYAAEYKIKSIPILVEAGFHVNARNLDAREALQTAIIEDNAEAIKVLIEAGINIHAEVNGWTPMQVALLSNKQKTVKMLQELGAKINFDRYSEFSRIIPASFYKERSLGIEWEGALKVHSNLDNAINNLKAELAERIIKREFSESNHRFILKVQGESSQSVKNRNQLLEEIKKQIQSGEIDFFKITNAITKKTQTFELTSSTLIVNPNSKNPEQWKFIPEYSIIIKNAYKNWKSIEFVSPVLKSLEDIQIFLSFLDDMIKKDLLSAQAVRDYSAGLHIHIGTQNLTRKEKSLFIETYLLVEKYLFHYFKPHRGRAHYAKPLELAHIIMNNQKDPLRKLNDKYRSVYFNEDYKTLEFRLFNSTSDADKIQFQAQFVRALLKGITHNKPQIVEWLKKEWQKRARDKNQNLNRDSLDEMFKILNLNPEFS